MSSDADVSTYSQRAPTVVYERNKIGIVYIVNLVISSNSEIKLIATTSKLLIAIAPLWIYA